MGTEIGKSLGARHTAYETALKGEQKKIIVSDFCSQNTCWVHACRVDRWSRLSWLGRGNDDRQTGGERGKLLT